MLLNTLFGYFSDVSNKDCWDYIRSANVRTALEWIPRKSQCLLTTYPHVRISVQCACRITKKSLVVKHHRNKVIAVVTRR